MDGNENIYMYCFIARSTCWNIHFTEEACNCITLVNRIKKRWTINKDIIQPGLIVMGDYSKIQMKTAVLASYYLPTQAF